MEKQFHNNDFEKIVRDHANQYRMYPSEKVWKGVYRALHQRRRWYGISAILLLFLTGSLLIIINPDQPQTNLPANQVDDTRNSDNQNPIGEKDISSTNRSTSPVFSPESERSESPGINQPLLTYAHQDLSSEVMDPEPGSTNPVKTQEHDPQTFPHYLSQPAEEPESSEKPENDSKLTQAINNSPQENENPADLMEKAVMALESQKAPIELNIRPSKITALVYFTPTVSYRKLSENKGYTRANPGVAFDVNEAVNHKPAMGLELGIEGRYSVTDRIFVKSGIQFNVNRYEIGAYFHPTEFASIPLTTNAGVDSLTALSNFRNAKNGARNWLQNSYFTISVPFGADYIFAENAKVKFGVSGSVQPTYVIGDRAYLISADYQNYAEVPGLMRRWNVSTDFEAFFMYSTGRLNWQVGPQIRYQHLSSFVDEYRVKENLFDIGLKVGATINKK